MKGLSFDELFPGTYVKASEFKGKAVTLTIRTVAREMLSNGTGGEEGAVIIGFDETEKKFVCNKTNGVSFRALFGDDSGDWLGHKITLHAVKDESGLSESGQCIRVFGSPELDNPLKFRAHLGRKIVVQTLQPTKHKTAPAEAEMETAEEFARLDETLDNPKNEKARERETEEELV